MIDHFGFGAAFWTMALSYLAAGVLLLFIPEEKPEGDFRDRPL